MLSIVNRKSEIVNAKSPLFMFRKKKYTEQEIIEGCKQNNRHAQEYLYKRYFANMMGMCLRYTSDREEAMTIVNNGFLRVFKKIDLFSGTGSLEGWIRRICWHCLSDYFRKHAKYLHFLVLEERDKPLHETALSNLYLDDLMKLVEKLPPATKQVFHLYAIEGFTHVEIGRKIGISEGTSKWHLATARKKLKTLIAKEQLMDNYEGKIQSY